MGEERRGGKAVLVGPPQSMVRCKVVLYIGLTLAKLAILTWQYLSTTLGSIHCGLGIIKYHFSKKIIKY